MGKYNYDIITVLLLTLTFSVYHEKIPTTASIRIIELVFIEKSIYSAFYMENRQHVCNTNF